MHSGEEREAEALRRRDRLAASLRETTRPMGTGTPAAAMRVLATSFCIAVEEASTPECV